MLPDKPFKLGTTSFIFPDHIIPNVKKLGRFFDEIELLVFESLPADVLPSKDDVKELLTLSRKLDLTYNIHLPVDISLSHDSLAKRQKAKDTLLKVIDLFALVTPTTHTLHLELPPGIKTDIKKGQPHQDMLKKWEDNTRESLVTFVSNLSNPGIISVETLDVPFSYLETLVDDFGLSICLDAGHQIKYGHNLLETYEKHKAGIPLIHLHGVDCSGQKMKDHTALDKLPGKYLRQIQSILNEFTGVVSLEVFNLENLNRSLTVLSKMFNNIAPAILKKII